MQELVDRFSKVIRKNSLLKGDLKKIMFDEYISGALFNIFNKNKKKK